MGHHLHEGHIETPLGEGLCHLDANQSAPDDDCRLCFSGCNNLSHGNGVFRLPQPEHMIEVHPFDREVDRLSTRGQNQPVIGKNVGFPGFNIDDLHGLLCPVDGSRQGAVKDIDVLDITEKNGVTGNSRRRGVKAAEILNIAADGVGHSAAGIGENFSPLDNCNFCLRIQSPEPSSSLGPCCDASNDQRLSSDSSATLACA